jgi:hypothetical protein
MSAMSGSDLLRSDDMIGFSKFLVDSCGPIARAWLCWLSSGSCGTHGIILQEIDHQPLFMLTGA